MVDRRILILFLLISGCCFFSACTKNLSPDEYKAYVINPAHGLIKQADIGDFNLSLLYEPADYIIATEDGVNDIVSRREALNDYEHFQFRIKLKSGTDILNHLTTSSQNAASRINHFSYHVHQDFILVSGQDTNRCKMVHYSRNYNLTPTVDLSLVFDKKENQKDWQLIYTDQAFNLGKVKFLLKQNDLADLPTLKLKTDEANS